MEMRGINHFHISVSDLEQSKKFYCEVFGMEEAFRIPQFIFLRCGKDLMTLKEGEDDQINTEGFHFGFDVNSHDEMNKWKDWLKKKNVSIDEERGDKNGAGIYFHDPDGHTIEIYFYKESP